jgi:hypothetical protein
MTHQCYYDAITGKKYKENNSDYWGFFDISRGEYSLIYRNLYCLTVCFPASMGVYEKIREGLFIKLDIIEEL